MASFVTLKQDGFLGERHVVVPDPVIRRARNAPVTRDLQLTAIGHFPYATGHYITRPDGIAAETILIYCSEGSGWCRIGGQARHLDAGSAIVIPAGTPHAYGTTKRRPWAIYWVHFSGRRVADYLSVLDVSLENPLLYLQRMGEILHHFESLYGLLNNGCSQKNGVALSTALANFLGQIVLYKSPGRVVRPTGMEQVKRTIPFMRQRLTSDVSLRELAGVAAFSVPHYSALFKTLTGYSPKAYYLRLKIQEAARILDATQMPVREVATHLGIRDPYYFSRLFKKIMNAPPSAYRGRYPPRR